MSPEEKKEFYIDVREYDWRSMIYAMAYGLRRYVIKEEAVAPSSTGYKQVL